MRDTWRIFIKYTFIANVHSVAVALCESLYFTVVFACDIDTTTYFTHPEYPWLDTACTLSTLLGGAIFRVLPRELVDQRIVQSIW